MTALLTVEDLSIGFRDADAVVQNVSFEVKAGETLALVGESGSGKTLSCRGILRILPRTAQIRSGRITLNGQNGKQVLSDLSERRMRDIRGDAVSMIFQEPMRSLSPLHKIGNQVIEVLNLHGGISKKAAKQQVLDTFQRVGFPDPERAYGSYPFEM